MNHFFFQKSNYVKSERHSKLSCFNIITLFTSTNNKLIQYIFNPKRKKLSQSNRYIFLFFLFWYSSRMVDHNYCWVWFLSWAHPTNSSPPIAFYVVPTHHSKPNYSHRGREPMADTSFMFGSQCYE